MSVLVLHETLLVPAVMYGSETYGRRRRDLGLGLYRWTTSGMLGIRKMDRVPNALVRELCIVIKGLVVFSNGSGMWKGIGLLRESV